MTLSVTLAAARVTLKQHRFEFGAAALAALGMGLWALFTEIRIGAIDVPPGCIDDWLTRGPAGRDYCVGAMDAWGGIVATEGEKIFWWMKLLPFAVGLIGGVPVIAREFESRTTQTAWSLYGSRLRWLVRQMAPIVILLGLTLTFAALAAGAIEVHRAAWGQPVFSDLGLHGPLVVTRALGAFGLGLLAGAVVGRSLPALVVGAVLSFTLASGVGIAREAWLVSLDSHVIDDTQRAITTGWAWRTPEGVLVSNQDAMALVPPELAELDGQQPQALNSIRWLEDHGYEPLTLGVTEEVALGWAPYDALSFGVVGIASIGATILIVNRRRPT